jgi:ribosomal protein S18
MKPHKKLNNELSFIECSIKYDDHDLLCNYVKNLTLCAPSYNIINLCVEYNKIELLKKYISEKIGVIDGILTNIDNKKIEVMKHELNPDFGKIKVNGKECSIS